MRRTKQRHERLPTLADRADELRAWARSRIGHCRDVEARFDSRSQSMIEAATERRALQAVLRILDGEETPR